MPDVKNSVKNFATKRKLTERSTLIGACVVIALSLAMFFVALFAPFQYYSNRDVLHVIYINADDAEDATVTIYHNKRVHQSLFYMFESATALSDASVLHAFHSGIMPEIDKLERAEERLRDLRGEYSSIYAQTIVQAGNKGIATSDEKFLDMLASNLSDMDLMALDMLEVANNPDNGALYDAMYSTAILGLFSALLNVSVMALAIVAIAMSVYVLIAKKNFGFASIFFKLFLLLSAVDMLLCVFNPSIPPAACPLALACIATAVFYIAGIARSFISDGSARVLCKNAVVGALVPISMLCISSIPSLTLYVNGLNDKFLLYPGTVGSVYYNWIKATVTIGLEIPHGAIMVSRVLGGIVCVLAAFCSYKALTRLYFDRNARDIVYYIGLFLCSALALSLVIAVVVITAQLQDAGRFVRYIPGACWYIVFGVTLVMGVFTLLFASPKELAAKTNAVADTVGDNAVESNDEKPENGENVSNAAVDADKSDSDGNSDDSANVDVDGKDEKNGAEDNVDHDEKKSGEEVDAEKSEA